MSFTDISGQSGVARPARNPSNSAGREPPHDLTAEKAVLSAIMLDNSVIHSLVTEVTDQDFYHPAHRILFAAMVQLKDRNEPVDLTTLNAHLEVENLLDAIGGVRALAEIADHEATAANALHYAAIVREAGKKRNLISLASEIVSLAYDRREPADKLLDTAQAQICSLGAEQGSQSLRSLRAGMHDAVDHIDMLMSRSGELTGLRTGYEKLDQITGGLQRGDLFILAARPSMGKTALALNLARNAAVDGGKKVAVFSLEMNTRALVMRMLSSEAQVDFSNVRSGLITPEAHGRLMSAATKLSEAGIWIDDSSSPSVLEIRSKSRRIWSEHGGLDLVVVDYLQLAGGSGRASSREQEIAEISRGLKGLAKELDVPVLALSQTNRGPEGRREDKRPMLSDLRESGAIEQDADVIGFIYRDVVYNRDTEHENLAELIIAKQRNGPTGTIRLEFEGRYAQFRDWPVSDDPYATAPGPGGGGFSGSTSGFGGGGEFADEDPF
ncbi:MAG: replicative DNA helicase [Myxococcota bacterium]|nr:replicative DNA helicase [Myxococcota bacterium]